MQQQQLPPGMTIRNKQWIFARYPGPLFVKFGIRIDRQRYDDLRDKFDPGSFKHRWWDVKVTVRCGNYAWIWSRWREATPLQMRDKTWG